MGRARRPGGDQALHAYLDDASQAAMQRLAEANNPKPAQEGKEDNDDCKDAT